MKQKDLFDSSLHMDESRQIRKIISQRIKKIVRDKQKTRYQICREAGIFYHTLASIERADSAYTIDTLVKICKVLDINLVEIFSTKDVA